ncbi:MAG: dehydrogenase E1 component subunit alpha/beta [Lentisphaeria bacterium]|nr:dehydrogenase E1 component subunit alpha/beta [Lentisphaeria bacterium]
MNKATTSQQAEMLRKMIEIRRFEEEVKRLYRAKEITGAIHLYIGQEAVAVGACSALRDDDFATSTHRPHGHCIAKVGDLPRTMAEMMGRETGLSGGFGGSMHQFCKEKGFLGGNGIVGGGMGIALGAAFSAQRRGTDQVTVCFFSDGASNQGVLSECLNLAALWKLPVIFLCENNRYAATTSVVQSTSTEDIAPRAEPYAIPWDICDGNAVLEVRQCVGKAVARARGGGGATFIEAKTYRVEPHCGIIADTRDEEELSLWMSPERDPIHRFEHLLLQEGALSEKEIQDVHAAVEADLESAIAFARGSSPPPLELITGRRYDVGVQPADTAESASSPAVTGSSRSLSYADAICEAQREEMERDETVFVIGEDVDIEGGVFKLTRGLLEAFGPERVVGTPISEEAFCGLAVGAAMAGLRPVVEIMYIDFILMAMDPIINQMAKIGFMSGGQFSMPVTIRAQAGAGTVEGAQHSQSFEAWFAHTPGFKVVMPGTAYDAKGLLRSAIRDDGPVLVIENRLLFYEKEDVPEGEWLVPIGQAEVVREGTDVTVVALGYTRRKALAAAESLEGTISVEVVDPRTIVPLDMATIGESVRKTGRLLVVHEAPTRNGFGAEIVRRVIDECFDYLDSPPRVLGGANVPAPFSPSLEQACIPQVDTIVTAIHTVYP